MLTIIKMFVILFLVVGIGNNMAIFKINQEALLSIECPGIFSWPKWRGEEGLFWRVQWRLSKMFLGNMMLSHWPCFTWKFFVIWFHKILKLIFQTKPSCPRNICTEHWRKLPNLSAFLEIFLYLKNNDSVEHVYKVLLCYSFISKVK